MTLGVLVTNYRAWQTTLATLEAVIELCPNDSELAQITVVDDASDAPSMWEKDKRVTIHCNSQNLGYVRSVNVGMALMEVDVVILLDCDARPLTAFAQEVRRQFDVDQKLGALGFTQTDDSQLLRPSGEPTPTLLEFLIGPAFFSRLPAFIGRRMLPAGRRLCIHSCCMAVRRSAFLQVGGFDEGFDFLDGDMDFSWSLLEHGWNTRITPEILCFHPGGGSPQSTGQRVLRFHRNRWRLLCKHGRVHWLVPAKLLLMLRHSMEVVALAVICLTPLARRLRPKLNTRWQLLTSVTKDYAR
ncbi:glycosyltransferase family 2 protein [Prosthecobacter sp.]|uniref:glycosyltransferase family 2 protein n=1 Tax=Prosthecobacter sp. TaxID=1965333 RepID=UPI00378389D8